MRCARPTCRPRDRDRQLPRECGWGGQCREPLILCDCLCFTQLIRLPKREQQESTKFARILREQGREREHMRCLHATTVVQFTSHQNSVLAPFYRIFLVSSESVSPDAELNRILSPFPHFVIPLNARDMGRVEPLHFLRISKMALFKSLFHKD